MRDLKKYKATQVEIPGLNAYNFGTLQALLKIVEEVLCNCPEVLFEDHTREEIDEYIQVVGLMTENMTVTFNVEE